MSCRYWSWGFCVLVFTVDDSLRMHIERDEKSRFKLRLPNQSQMLVPLFHFVYSFPFILSFCSRRISLLSKILSLTDVPYIFLLSMCTLVEGGEGGGKANGGNSPEFFYRVDAKE